MGSQASRPESDTLNAYERVVQKEEEAAQKRAKAEDAKAKEDDPSDLYRQHSHQQSMEGG